ncbi:MAG: hypothetical protein JWQ19_3632 [Subtercola sp.]|nr:hypothetical protein [Subtercola sp.]
MADNEQVAYTALEPKTPVLDTEGAEFGTVEHVLQMPISTCSTGS